MPMYTYFPSICTFSPFSEYLKVFSFSLHSTGSGDIESLPKVWDISALFWKIFKQWRTFLWNSFLAAVLKLLFHIHQSSPGNLSMNNQPGTPRDDGEMSGNFLNPFQSESVCMQKAFSVGSLVLNTAAAVNQNTFLSFCSILQTWQWVCERTAQEWNYKFLPCYLTKQNLLSASSLVFYLFSLWWAIVNYSEVILL